MTGGDGNDSYFVDNGGDVVTEASGTGGTDVVNSSVSFTLGANLEKLVLTGTLAINGTGNGLANTLTGNAAANSLNGGAGADAMAGGDGNDLYFVDDAGDKAIEARSAGGTDGVSSSVSFTLGAFVENLTLSGASAVNGTGNELANLIVGNGAANILSGAAGADTLRGGSGGDELHGGIGFDTLQGDGGSDRFVFDTALLSTNIDHIVDFTRGSDKIVLDDAVFRGLAVGAVPSGAIVIGTSATAPDDRIIYDPGTGALFFDRDGSGTAAAAIQFATLDNKPATLTANDFLVI
jgi:Ca2+-binding RTX toxin-like protein